MSNGEELVLHKKPFRQLTTDELYELLGIVFYLGIHQFWQLPLFIGSICLLKIT